MLRSVNGNSPVVHPSAHIAPDATLVGAVFLEENSSVWYHATLRADYDSIRVGRCSNLQDNCVVHVDCGQPCIIGAEVTVGHGAILHSCTIEDGCTIGMGSIILNGAVVGEGSIVGAGALITKNTVIPPRSLVVGSPAQVKRQVSDQELEHSRRAAQEYVKAAAEQL